MKHLIPRELEVLKADVCGGYCPFPLITPDCYDPAPLTHRIHSFGAHLKRVKRYLKAR